eukprot:m.184315 g.184315  ORF g.184315 m.184315 type:complete len:64 (+) comp39318_c4_seq22:5833-6024(+)
MVVLYSCDWKTPLNAADRLKKHCHLRSNKLKECTVECTDELENGNVLSMTQQNESLNLALVNK